MTVPIALDDRFRAEAAARRLLDVAYDVTDSPIGPLLVAKTERGICRVAFDGGGEHEVDRLAQTFGARVLRSPRPLEPVLRQLDDYFERRRDCFDVGVDLAGIPPFKRLVLGELARGPYGETATYGALAARVGSPRAARAVGGALNRNPIPILLPCHRVVGASGSLVGYAGGLERKRVLLALEGATV
jgi:methylated-DNA-[protein]-cysteine S-methyltransferase